VQADGVEGWRGRHGEEREGERASGVEEVSREVVFGVGTDRWAPPGAAAAGQLPSAHTHGGSGVGHWGGWAACHEVGLGRRGWATRGQGEAAAGPHAWLDRKERGREEKGKMVFPFSNLFSKCMISQIHSTNKIDAWSGMVQQPLGFYLHKMSS
jgi:hypothetical protein